MFNTLWGRLKHTSRTVRVFRVCYNQRFDRSTRFVPQNGFNHRYVPRSTYIVTRYHINVNK